MIQQLCGPREKKKLSEFEQKFQDAFDRLTHEPDDFDELLIAARKTFAKARRSFNAFLKEWER